MNMRLYIALFSAVLAWSPLGAFGSASEARRLFVEAEMLRRAEVCEVGDASASLDPLAQILAWSFIEHHEKARQLKPLLPALASLEDLSSPHTRR
jgi:hypothetical protein